MSAVHKNKLLFVISGNSQHATDIYNAQSNFKNIRSAFHFLTMWRICAFNHFKVNIPMTGHD